MRCALIACFLLVSRSAVADLANNEAIHDHVDRVVLRLEVDKLDPDQRHDLLADRLTLSLSALVPIYGSYCLDHKVFGDVRPAAVVFDWILGGIVPTGLGATALLSGDALSSRTRTILGWSAVGLYVSTRIGVLIIGNLHISEYNRYLRLRLGVVVSPSDQLAPALLASSEW